MVFIKVHVIIVRTIVILFNDYVNKVLMIIEYWMYCYSTDNMNEVTIIVVPLILFLLRKTDINIKYLRRRSIQKMKIIPEIK